MLAPTLAGPKPKAAAAPLRPEADTLPAPHAPAGSLSGCIADAQLEPMLVEARTRHASYRESGVSVVSLVVMIGLIIVGLLA